MTCERIELLDDLALGLLPTGEARSLEAHAAECSECRKRLSSLRLTVEAFAAWPLDVLSPSPTLSRRLFDRLGGGERADPHSSGRSDWAEPAWEEVAPGISVKLLAIDPERSLVSMLVRLAPGTEYPPHTHAGTEELHLLDGELWIDDRKLVPGDYNLGRVGATDFRVWSETGCTCVLITSTRDRLLP